MVKTSVASEAALTANSSAHSDTYNCVVAGMLEAWVSKATAEDVALLDRWVEDLLRAGTSHPGS
ncbi:hypothetical protein PsYK624_148200 [Phanerochaete sordida]|uniref:Uncharacterized protein n=1 Tax=Phanerochaete sordida TaxID=48140 RepID=A0A9P3GNB8_9APHY|nr:hypothetical protein PsYK624_148200 [Phanerochaete sordida]